MISSTVWIGVPTWTLSERVPSVTAPAGIEMPLLCNRVAIERGVDAGGGQLRRVGRDQDLLGTGAGDDDLADALDGLELGDDRLLQPVRQRGLVVAAVGGGQDDGRDVVGAAGEDDRLDVVGQRRLDPVDRGGQLVDRVVEVGAELEKHLDGGRALAGRRLDGVQAVGALDGVLDRLGHLLFHDLRARARQHHADERAGELERGQQLLFERRHRVDTEAGDHHRDKGDEPPVSETEPGQKRHLLPRKKFGQGI
nr:hypothetical protein GCM10020092_015300 [Actinoplanes digitatis]